MTPAEIAEVRTYFTDPRIDPSDEDMRIAHLADVALTEIERLAARLAEIEAAVVELKPLPEPPGPAPATVSITVDATYGMLGPVKFADPLQLVWLGATIEGKYIPPGSVLYAAVSSTVWLMSEVTTALIAGGPVTLTRRA